MQRFDAVVVGAGPAGLSAAAELSTSGSVLLIEQGPPAASRRRDVPEQVLSGVGGAGLFSDGKHSFFPSASALWTLPDRAALQQAFASTAALLRAHGIDAGPMPQPTTTTTLAPGSWQEKLYPALYVPFAERLRCIEQLWSTAADRRLEARVVGAVRDGQRIVLDVESPQGSEQVAAGAVVVATGRWSPRWTRPWLTALGATYAFGRVEFGVRIETAASAELFARLPGVDGKLRFVDTSAEFAGTEFRTFCTCREGEVVLGRAEGVSAFSGHADGPRSGRSSVGLLARSTSSSSSAWGRLGQAAPERLSLRAWRAGGAQRLSSTLGERGAEVLWRGLQHLLAWCPSLVELEDAEVFSPCIEGVGDYAVDDGSLQVAPNVFVVGDAGGRFRGIVASMISGRYAALKIAAG
ncbi:MAG: FAD-dependent oxidoreductase [Deltaproteobacteria bacterium]|nr:FAD-dependent oxidoreductase [Deltaproteobacteria bacterium]